MIEKYNLTTKKFDWKQNKIKIPIFSRESICFIDLSRNDSQHNRMIVNEKHEEAAERKDFKVEKLKEAEASSEKNQDSFFNIKILETPISKNLKLNENLSNLQKDNQNKINAHFNRDELKYSFLKIQGN